MHRTHWVRGRTERTRTSRWDDITRALQVFWEISQHGGVSHRRDFMVTYSHTHTYINTRWVFVFYWDIT